MNYAAFLGMGAVIVVLVVGMVVWSSMRAMQAPSAIPTIVPQQEGAPVSASVVPSSSIASPSSFRPKTFTQTKAAHFVSSEPANNTILTATPASVKINFNFDLAPPSKITVTRDSADVTSGETTISSDKLSLSVPVSANETGNYQVNYTACWQDKSCHDGSFGFAVNVTP